MLMLFTRIQRTAYIPVSKTKSVHCTLGCFKIAPLSNFLTAQQIFDGVWAADYEFDIIF